MNQLEEKVITLETRVDHVNTEIGSVEFRLGERITEVKTDLKEDIKQVQTNLKDVKTELKDEIQGKQASLLKYIALFIAAGTVVVPVLITFLEYVLKGFLSQ